MTGASFPYTKNLKSFPVFTAGKDEKFTLTNYVKDAREAVEAAVAAWGGGFAVTSIHLQL